MAQPERAPAKTSEPSSAPAGAVDEGPHNSAELVQLAVLHREQLQKLEQEGRLSAAQLALERTVQRGLTWAVAELARGHELTAERCLQVAAATADLLQLPRPHSHRSGVVGRAVTLSKRAFVRGLRPLHVELLRPQTAFNLQLTRVLKKLLVDDGVARAAMRTRAQERLAPLTRNTRWDIRSHRGSWKGTAVETLKRSYVGAMAPLLEPALERMQAWNEAALEMVLLAADEAPPPLHQVHAGLGKMKALNGLPSLPADDLARRTALPLLLELFKQQEFFAGYILQAFEQHFGLPRRGEQGASFLYPALLLNREQERIRASGAQAAGCASQPLFSIITPTYETPEALLRACLDSVLAQTYERWELCIVDDGSKSASVRRVLSEYAAQDPRIRVKFLDANVGIAGATNQALQLASGDFVCFLDHDDELRPHALAEYVLHVDAHPETDVLYSDEDRLSMDGKRSRPFFKPDWSPDLLRACNYVCHFLAARRTVVDEVGGVRLGFDGSQDYDLILRLSEKARRVGHVPEVLYHWRAAPQSTASDIGNKPAATQAGVRALEDHLRRVGTAAVVSSPVPTNYRVNYLTVGTPSVSVVVCPHDGADLARWLDGLAENTQYAHYEVLVAGGGPLFEGLKKYQDRSVRQLLLPKDLSDSAKANAAAHEARGDVLVFIAPRTEFIQPSWLTELVGNALRPDVGAVAPKLLFPDMLLAEAGLAVTESGEVLPAFAHLADGSELTTFGSPQWTRNCLALSGACVAIRRSVFLDAGGFDEALADGAPELCLRLARAGRWNVYTPHARLVLHGAPSPVKALTASGGVTHDPFYPPRLSRTVADGSFVGSEAFTHEPFERRWATAGRTRPRG